jgi:hypothetical protein
MTYVLLVASSHSTATVSVVKDEVPFVVHRELVTATSGPFQKRTQGSFKEKGGTIKLREGNIKALDIYTRWLYRCQLCIKYEGDVRKIMERSITTV